MKKVLTILIVFVISSLPASALLINAQSKKSQHNIEGKIEKELKRIKDKRFPKRAKKKEVKKTYITKKHKTDITDGKGIWINKWYYPHNVRALISKLKKYDIDTIYLQINRSNTDVFSDRAKVDEILLQAHKRDIKVIGWSYCFLRDIKSDATKFIEPALYVSKEGHGLDGMAADIEENIDIKSVTKYTETIKAKLPDDYPLIAIVYSPKIKTKYPWEYIANNWDVLMPMTYWHGLKGRNELTVHNFVRDTIQDLKRLTKRDDLMIHLITDGDRTSAKEVAASLKAAKKFGVNAGVSIYPEHIATPPMLEALRKF